MALITKLLDVEPSSYHEATTQQVWRDAMVEEYASIIKNDVWEVVSRTKGKPVACSCWIYKIKHGVDGSIEKLRARLLAKGFL